MRSIRGSRKGFGALYAKKRKPKRKLMKAYHQRNCKIKELGYSTYRAYLKSDDWRIIRTRKLTKYPWCLLCPNPSSQVHHISYDYATLLGLNDFLLIQLCSKCHEELEFDGNRKRERKEANAVLFDKASKTTKGKLWIDWFEHRSRATKAGNKKRREAAKLN